MSSDVMFVAVVCVSYPRKSRASLHRAHCYIPAALAAIFDESPSLIAPVVHAFYHRDPLDLKVLLTSPVIILVPSSFFNMLECEFILTSMSQSQQKCQWTVVIVFIKSLMFVMLFCSR